MEKNCSIILLCGYLGSGKTTLIQYILNRQSQYKVAVIQNEFSDEMGIEAPLMKDSKGELFDKFYELPNGCICCSAKSDLLRAIEYFIMNESYKLDYILIETNGLADPSSTIKTFWTDEELKFPATLKSIVSIIPAHKFLNLKKEEIFMKQTMFANIILINQIDKIDDLSLQSIEKELLQINPLSIIYKTKFCEIDVNLIFDNSGFEMTKMNLDLLQTLETFNSHHSHSELDYVTLNFGKEIEFNLKELEKNIGYLIWEKPENCNILRIKAIVSIFQDEFIYSLQSVDDVFELKRSDIKWKELGIQKYSRFLFIGNKLELFQLQKYLKI